MSRAAAYRMIAAGFAALADSEVEAAPELYDQEHLPPGAASWRAVLEAGRRGELEVTRVGRRSAVTAAAWAAFIFSKKTRTVPAPITESDEKRLEALGVVLPMRRTGTR